MKRLCLRNIGNHKAFENYLAPGKTSLKEKYYGGRNFDKV